MLNFTQSRKTTADTIKSCDYSDYTIYDGYTWAEVQHNNNLHINPAFGDWPYVMVANGATNDSFIIKEYAEHDVKTWVYQDNEDGREQYTHHLNQLKAYWDEQNGEA